ncbi:aspartate ammonia-lyase [Grimontia sp. NTOU-MAR1]|uniref:aspartate ammonia-lyase n=1 Tax=Grimontia sp. NTOU-MAR1 TaxID=3111011 RepID=UPI002DBB3112|nr:aspartate ammonia-lyase [Grimontia sp. NTOU-MAR1]WRV99110.1 aspartate ammonia-lyase [Grimontia sp. NTOU-MAR1]
MSGDTQKTRIETDCLGSVEIPHDALYGINTARAKRNFDVSPLVLGDQPEYVRALALVKQASAIANHQLGALSEKKSDAITRACEELAKGKHCQWLITDMLEGSGGTSTNMNMNEVIANRGLAIMGFKPGEYQHLHPNDDVNCSQSTNDVIPTAIHIALLTKAPRLLDALNKLSHSLSRKADEFSSVLRLGRTCLQSAQPMTLGQAFSGYAAVVRRRAKCIELALEGLNVVALGGTAIGTGFGSLNGYRALVNQHLSNISGLNILPAEEHFDVMQNADDIARLSSEIRITAETLGKIATDFTLLGSDDAGGLGEIALPECQAGSSIMPGKVNPVIPMMVQQVWFSVVGNDAAISMAASHGQLEINHFEPVMTTHLFDSLNLLTNACTRFDAKCVSGLEAKSQRSLNNLLNSSALATALVPQMGYQQVAEIVREKHQNSQSFLMTLQQHGLMSEDEAKACLKRCVYTQTT